MITKKTIARRNRANGAHEAYWVHGTNGAYGLLRLLVTLSFIIFNISFSVAQIRIGGNVYGGGNQGNVEGSTKVTVRAGDIGAVLDSEAERPLKSPRGKVFGGARMADVGGNTFVHIDGENATGYIVANQVYGGNDIAGTIGTAKAVDEEMPAELTAVKRLPADDDDSQKNAIDDTWNSYVRVSTKTNANGNEVSGAKKIYIGQVFAGGNGDYYYENDNKIVRDKNGTEIASRTTPFTHPELGKAYLEVVGGSIVYAYGGGNNATVTEETVIHVDNPGEVVNHILVDATGVEANAATYTTYETSIAAGTPTVPSGFEDLLTTNRFKEMGINTGLSKPSSAEFQIGRFFGGNNHADMTIRPTWNLLNGKIRNLYSGGNHGRMLHDKGLLLKINNVKYLPVPSGKKLNEGLAYFTSNTGGGRFIAAGTEVSDGTNYYSTLTIDNVYGGCRMGDVDPKILPLVKDDEGEYKSVNGIDGKIDGYNFPDNLAARVIVAAGDINNVYGGNDVTGRVHFGNAVGVHTSIRGDIYGGGNGAYAYTDNQKLENDNVYGDLYYASGTGVEGLLNIRPDAEQVSVSLRGNDKDHPTIIGGSVYVGGNCATLRIDPKHADAETYPETALKNYPLTELKIGSHVIAENAFLGNNGEDMVKFNEKSATELEGVLRTYARTDIPGTDGTKFNSMDLTAPGTFAAYMDGIALGELPRVIEESTENNDRLDYEPYTSYIGSVFYGSNRGSMNYSGSLEITYPVRVTIYDKLVAGCNNANIAKTKYNARYEGGILGDDAEVDYGYTDDSGKIKDRIVMNLSGTKIRPLRLNSTKTGLEWNIYNLDAGGEYVPQKDLVSTPQSGATLPAWTGLTTGPALGTDISRRLVGGNVYGGCYESGHVNGNVVINLKGSLHDRHDIFDAFEGEEDGDDILYEPPSGGYKITDRRSGVILNEQGMDVLGDALSIYGGGKGAETEIWGSTTINIESGYNFQVFGGSENGVIGKGEWVEGTTLNATTEIYEGGKYVYPETTDSQYSTYVNLNSKEAGVSRAKDSSEDITDVEFIYGGGNNGLIVGNTNVNLDNGRLFNLFAGSCNADILGHTETYVGLNGFPYLRDHIYGGNDLGGEIKGSADFSGQVRNYNANKTKIHGYDKDNPSAVPAVLKANAYVEYRKGKMKNIYGGCFGDYDYDEEFTVAKGYSSPKLNNAFVNFRPNSDEKGQSHVDRIFGAGEGCSGFREGDKMQNSSYVLVDIPFIKNPEDPGDNLSEKEYFTTTEVFGSGENNGLGMTAPPPADAVENPGESGSDEAKEAYRKYQAYQDYLANPDAYSAIIDLLGGQIRNVFGGSYNEGITRRTVVNVPENSNIWMYSTEPDEDPDETKHVKEYGNIFGGAYGTQVLPPCDVIESNVNYRSSNAVVNGSIFGGNNNERRTLRTKVNIFSPVWSHKDKEIKGYTATVYGAGQGKDTWAEYTEVNLEDGANVYEVYGGGMMGHVLNTESVQKYMQSYQTGPSNEIAAKDPFWNDSDKWTINAQGQRIPTSAYEDKWKADWADAWTLGDYYSPVVLDGNGDVADYDYTTYVNNKVINLSLVSPRAELDDVTASQLAGTKKYNANVIINEGATVSGYAYGGGYGKKAASPTDPNYLSGDIYGTTYIALLGGTVGKDIYAAGTTGSVIDLFGTGTFTASANAYIQGGTCRNVYGGGWKGHVGVHNGDISASSSADIPGETHVVIGILAEDLPTNPKSEGEDGFDPYFQYHNGIPAIQRNAYGGGEGGAVYGTANITVNNGYIGYVHLKANEKQNEQGRIVSASGEDLVERYDDKIIDETWKDKETNEFLPNTNLDDAGCVFGGGYIDDSFVDKTLLKIYGGHIRGSVFGGGEIAAIGRGTIEATTSEGQIIRRLSGLHRPGKTNIEMFGGHVGRNLFGGGRGHDNLGRHGTLNCDGYIFGQTEVHVHGGEIGTAEGIAAGYGNVFGGSDIGFVYSALEEKDGEGNPVFYRGVKTDVRYGGQYQGYYYKHAWNNGSSDEQTESLFAHQNGDERIFTEDCKVLIEPHCKSSAELSFTGIKYQKGESLSSIDLAYLKANASTYSSQLANIDAYGNVTAAGGISFDRTYPSGSYVPVEALNTMKSKNADERWASLDPTGIIIHNAVFAGGNTPPGSALSSANTASVFGNATATIHDIYHRDMITLGTGHTGGLYGDGNLTLVDGYRELNITNYGTDYYSILKEINIDAYHALPAREAAYYELNYTCIKDCQDKNDTWYHKAVIENGVVKTKAATITADDMLDLFLEYDNDTQQYVSIKDDYGKDILVWDGTEKVWKPNTESGTGYWEESGVLPVYAGRLMNSIQRADFCGIYGSRMVMQGAKDRVVDEADNTNYTINRVREVSLNKKESVIAADNEKYDDDDEALNPEHKAGTYKNPTDQKHGNYFGIYSIVNYLGALTSDVDFGDIRVSDNKDTETYQADIVISKGENPGTYQYGKTGATYYNWKQAHIKEKTRNNGNSHNKVALASGVYLELTTEESTGTDLDEKVWGPITGVVELDLINVAPGIGGGFVYAKNVHGKRTKTNIVNTTLTALNKGAVTQWDYTYATTPDQAYNATDDTGLREWETSGNFVHSTQTIIDDCYNISGRYYGTNKVPAHYWYIKGSVYVYDQYITAYTGSSNAFSESVDIPLTITAASHGKMTLLNVMPNRYAYYASPGIPLNDGQKMIINNTTYYKNDPISYWDWYLLSKYEKELFIEKTYVNCVAVNIDDATENGAPKVYEPGTYIMTESQYNSFGNNHTYKDADGEIIKDANKEVAGTSYIFRQSNNLSHDTGYILTYKVNNPGIWDTWYTESEDADDNNDDGIDDTENITPREKNQTGGDGFEDGPTYRLKAETGGQLLGQSEYKVGDLIPKSVEDTYKDVKTNHSTAIPTNDTENPAYDPKKKQATFMAAYIVPSQITVTETDGDRHYNKGTAVPADFAAEHGINIEDNIAYICTNSVQISKEDIIYKGSKMSKKQADDYIKEVETKMGDTYKSKTIDELKALEVSKELIQLASLRDDMKKCLVPAYYCTDAGKYGGNYYAAGQNYRGLEAWSSMSAADRDYFFYNYDALDLLIDPAYRGMEGKKYQYDGATYNASTNTIVPFSTEDQAKTNLAGYSVTQKIDYTATYYGDNNLTLDTGVTVKHSDGSTADNVTTLVAGDELTRDVFESLPNEQRYYSAIAVKDGKLEGTGESATYTVYVVSTSFQIGSTPYAIGETISYDTFRGLPDSDQEACITKITFPATEVNNSYYFCREPYTMVTTVTPVTKTVVGARGGLEEDDEAGTTTVTLGTLIASGNGTGQYGSLPNKQKSFSFHGILPTETSTLYVSRESDIYNLSKDKIVTVVYQYDYDEVDESGNVTPISERHVLNIHLQFQSGVPTVEDITKPEIILPGDYVTIRDPNVTPGAYEVTGGGWELFERIGDAESHTNGIDYIPMYDPLYWYQHDWYVAYYAKTYLGRTYSNAVPVSVANYHDLAKVMADLNHHMYIDNKNVKREPKIYINDYTTDDPATTQNGLDLFKDLYDLSLVTGSGDGYTVSGGKITAAVAPGNTNLKDHALLNNHIRAERNLEFFLRTDIEREKETVSNPDYDPSDPESPETITRYKSWTPIGYNGVCDDPTTAADEAVTNAGKCFDGTFHGDGHTISGLDHSLFNYLCGDVYNLGVTGSFTGGGVAETGSGYVENCWVNTTGTPEATSSTGVRAVFGNPSAASGTKQIVNSYCQTGKIYNTSDANDHGVATAKPDAAFYNGEVAYDLNGFYLYKRYNDNANPGGTTTYKYWKKAGETEPLDGSYAENKSLCSSGYNGMKYVEDRFEDGDFRYAAGVIPSSQDDRYYLESKTSGGVVTQTTKFYPIWPDDYLFFGQMLTFGWAAEAHQDLPSAIVRDGGRLPQNSQNNRVYRAPAYYRNSTMSMAHFNPNVYLAQTKKGDASTKVYPGMTAIDFAGHYDIHEPNGAIKPYVLGLSGNWFYPPLLDDDGLLSITNCDETQNLLVYAPSEDDNKKTYDVVNGYFKDPAYSDYYDNTDYKCVGKVLSLNVEDIHGHVVQNDTHLTATSDHLLVDKQDFDCPIPYSFDDDKLMWYQRVPDNYVGQLKDASGNYRNDTGWEGVSLPFTAELVTTTDKGEITHFYDGSETSKNGSEKIGHEYWLRELKKSGNMTEKSAGILEAEFLYPVISYGSSSLTDDSETMDKTVDNTFLWDYYYNADGKHTHKDKNADEYQTYYGDSRTYDGYAMLTRGIPYIIGFPGERYYEFDLSGAFYATTTATPNPEKLGKQTITFASAKGASIGRSDDEKVGVENSYLTTNYTFKPSYLNSEMKEYPTDPTGGVTYDVNYTLNKTGNSYELVEEASPVTTEAFRPFFAGSITAPSSSPAKEYKGMTRSIVFNNGASELIYQEEEDDISNTGDLFIRAKKDKIVVSSTLAAEKDVLIVNAAGALIDRYTIQPGETRETKVNASGVYIVNKKKLSVKIKD